MIRIRQLIKKDELLRLIDNPDVVKFEVRCADTNRLKNKNICAVYVYYRTEKKNECCDNAVNSILGACAKAIKDDTANKFLEKNDHAFLNGIQHQKHDNFLKASMITKLLKIQEKYDTPMNVSKEIRNLVKKYNYEKI